MSFGREKNALESLLNDLETVDSVDVLMRRNAQEQQAGAKLGEIPESFSSEPTGASSSSFKVGQQVYALYYVDGLYYKAEILSLVGTFSCVVVFTEYQNTQETMNSDILEEGELRNRLEQGGSVTDPSGNVALKKQSHVEQIRCPQCDEENDATEKYCLECGSVLQKEEGPKEDPEERAARLLLELTPYGDCLECGATIMMSDDMCLVCNTPRGETKRKSRISYHVEEKERLDRESGGTSPSGLKKDVEEKEQLDRESGGASPSGMASPRKMITDLFRKGQDSEDESSPNKNKGHGRLRGSKKDTEDNEGGGGGGGEEAASPRGGKPSLADRLRGSKKDDTDKRTSGSGKRYEAEAEDEDKEELEPKAASPRGKKFTEMFRGSNKEEKEKEKEKKVGFSGNRYGNSNNSNVDEAAEEKKDGAASPRGNKLFGKKTENDEKKEELASPRGKKFTDMFKSKKEEGADANNNEKSGGGGDGKSLFDKLKHLDGFRLKTNEKSKKKSKKENRGDEEENLANRPPLPQKVEKKVLQLKPQTTSIVFAASNENDEKSSNNKKEAPAPSSGAPPALPPKPAQKPALPPKKKKVVKKNCLVCHLQISPGEPICDFGGTEIYHARCWKCTYCSKALRKYYRIEGSPVCEGCFEEKKVASRLVCSTCKKPVTEYYRVGGAIFCPQDYLKSEKASKLKCDICAVPLSSYYSHQGKMLCQEHYEATALKKCKACSKPLKKYYTMDNGDNGYYLCEEDYQKERLKNAKRCCVCRAIVSGSYTKIGDQIYCQRDEPKCVDCGSDLQKYVEREKGKGEKEKVCVPCSKRGDRSPRKISNPPQKKKSSPAASSSSSTQKKKISVPSILSPRKKSSSNSSLQSSGPRCPHCKCDISVDAKFCSGCGKKTGR